MTSMIKCSEASCPGRLRRGGRCPLCGNPDIVPDSRTRSLMDHRGHRGGGRQVLVDGRWVAIAEARQIAYRQRGAA